MEEHTSGATSGATLRMGSDVDRLYQTIAPPPLQPTERLHQLVTIEKVTNGFIIRVGCKTFVGTNWTGVATGLAIYWDEPAKAERMYCKERR
uniref:Uncharacterized protein n=1 Tax=viral metagenome TaxID=1070528 RepID=A0A6H1ZPM9_9ZZZZ